MNNKNQIKHLTVGLKCWKNFDRYVKKLNKSHLNLLGDLNFSYLALNRIKHLTVEVGKYDSACPACHIAERLQCENCLNKNCNSCEVDDCDYCPIVPFMTTNCYHKDSAFTKVDDGFTECDKKKIMQGVNELVKAHEKAIEYLRK